MVPSPVSSELLLQRMGASLVFIQPAKNGKPHGPSLMVELQSGTVGMAEHSMPIHELGGQGTPEKVLGIIGLAKLVSCSVLAVITHAEKVILSSTMFGCQTVSICCHSQVLQAGRTKCPIYCQNVCAAGS